jgi:rubrerythrin
MTIELPENAPKTSQEAFAYVGAMGPNVTIDDLKILALTEALGLELYAKLAQGTENMAVRDLLLENGREELLHAERVSQAIEILTGQPFPIPPIDENPIYTPLPVAPLTREALQKLADAEYAGENLYAGVASSFDDAQAKALFLQNGKEEAGHGRRLAQAAELLV